MNIFRHHQPKEHRAVARWGTALVTSLLLIWCLAGLSKEEPPPPTTDLTLRLTRVPGKPNTPLASVEIKLTALNSGDKPITLDKRFLWLSPVTTDSKGQRVGILSPNLSKLNESHVLTLAPGKSYDHSFTLGSGIRSSYKFDSPPYSVQFRYCDSESTLSNWRKKEDFQKWNLWQGDVRSNVLIVE